MNHILQYKDMVSFFVMLVVLSISTVSFAYDNVILKGELLELNESFAVVESITKKCRGEYNVFYAPSSELVSKTIGSIVMIVLKENSCASSNVTELKLINSKSDIRRGFYE